MPDNPNVDQVKRLLASASVSLSVAEEIDPRLLNDFRFVTARDSLRGLVKNLGPLVPKARKIDGLFRGGK